MTIPDVRVAGFADLPAGTAYRIWALRADVFVVEQNCPYADLDGRDLEPSTRQVWAEDEDGTVVATLRVLDDHDGEVARIGRVATAPAFRGRGLAARLMTAAHELAGERDSVLDAQSHLADWYARFGYARNGLDFIEDGIPHTPMRRVAARLP